MRSVSNYFDDGERRYLSGVDAETTRSYCTCHHCGDDMADIWVSSNEEPDPDELAAFWHEEEVSL
jgi:hypothetical protein